MAHLGISVHGAVGDALLRLWELALQRAGHQWRGGSLAACSRWRRHPRRNHAPRLYTVGAGTGRNRSPASEIRKDERMSNSISNANAQYMECLKKARRVVETENRRLMATLPPESPIGQGLLAYGAVLFEINALIDKSAEYPVDKSAEHPDEVVCEPAQPDRLPALQEGGIPFAEYVFATPASFIYPPATAADELSAAVDALSALEKNGGPKAARGREVVSILLDRLVK